MLNERLEAIGEAERAHIRYDLSQVIDEVHFYITNFQKERAIKDLIFSSLNKRITKDDQL